MEFKISYISYFGVSNSGHKIKISVNKKIPDYQFQTQLFQNRDDNRCYFCKKIRSHICSGNVIKNKPFINNVMSGYIVDII